MYRFITFISFIFTYYELVILSESANLDNQCVKPANLLPTKVLIVQI